LTSFCATTWPAPSTRRIDSFSGIATCDVPLISTGSTAPGVMDERLASDRIVTSAQGSAAGSVSSVCFGRPKTASDVSPETKSRAK